MTLRTYQPMKQSRGTVWPREVKEAALLRDGGCLGPRIGMPGECFGEPQLDHIRASGGIGMKSRSTLDNAASLCAPHHRLKTNAGRTWRPILLDYLEQLGDPHAAHVDPCPGCPPRKHYLGDGWTHIGDADYPYSEVSDVRQP